MALADISLLFLYYAESGNFSHNVSHDSCLSCDQFSIRCHKTFLINKVSIER